MYNKYEKRVILNEKENCDEDERRIESLKKIIEEINKELSELSEEELSQVVGEEGPLTTPTGRHLNTGIDLLGVVNEKQYINKRINLKKL